VLDPDGIALMGRKTIAEAVDGLCDAPQGEGYVELTTISCAIRGADGDCTYERSGLVAQINANARNAAFSSC
jgi:hypothetical protein